MAGSCTAILRGCRHSYVQAVISQVDCFRLVHEPEVERGSDKRNAHITVRVVFRIKWGCGQQH
jgi:hypothetical protein